MKHFESFQPISRFHTALSVSAAVGLLLAAPLVRADDPITMAPPVQPAYSQPSDGAYQDVSQDSTNTSQDSVFNWTEVPQDQPVPITRAVFDKGGYQLYDTQGETVIVPFANQNLYVMKFGQSKDGTTYFENEGTVPVLFIPKGGYLENASAPGTRWYPFPKEYHYEQPVFLGVAPSYPEFVDMGWYPGMVCYGGYYSHRSFVSGGVFLPIFGLAFFIGEHHYYGWEGYHDYYYRHPAPYHVTIINNNYYHRDDNYFGGRPSFGGRSSFGSRPGFGGRPFNGTGHPDYANRSFGTHTFGSSRTFGGREAGGRPLSSGRTFGGGSAGQPVWAHHTFSGTRGTVRPNSGDRPGFGGGTHTFQGDRSSNGGGNRTFGSPSRPSFNDEPRTSGIRERTSSGPSHTSNDGGRVFGGGGRVFNSPQSSPATHSEPGGGRVFGGGGRPSHEDSGRASNESGGRSLSRIGGRPDGGSRR